MNPLLLTLAIGALPERLALTFEQAPGGCALDVRLPQSIARYVPRLSLATENGQGTWTLAVSSTPGQVEIVLSDDQGAEQLRRALRAEPEACAATADGIGLILERYLSDLGYETGFTPLPEIAPPPPAVTATIARRVDTSTPAAPLDVDMEIGGGIGGDLSLNRPRLGLGIEVALAVLFLRFEASAFGMFLGKQAVERDGAQIGEYRVWSAGGVFRIGACVDLASVSLCGMLGPGFEWVSGSTTGETVFDEVAQDHIGFIFSPTLYAAISIGIFRLYFRGDWIIRADRLKLEVLGADDPYRDSRMAAFLSLGAAVQIF